MSDRTGLAAEVPEINPCAEMRDIPVLRDAFADSPLWWFAYGTMDDSGKMVNYTYKLELATAQRHRTKLDCPAPTVREMLVVMLDYCRRVNRAYIFQTLLTERPESLVWMVGKTQCGWQFDITDPDALARACIATAKAN